MKWGEYDNISQEAVSGCLLESVMELGWMFEVHRWAGVKKNYAVDAYVSRLG